MLHAVVERFGNVEARFKKIEIKELPPEHLPGVVHRIPWGAGSQPRVAFSGGGVPDRMFAMCQAAA